MSRAVIALGANLGDPRAAVLGAIDVLAADEGVTVVAISKLYETDPVGGPEQPMYVNAVVVVDSTRSPMELLDLAHSVEQQWQRVRDIRWGPRTLDVDLIDVDGVVSDDPVLTLPHPRAFERAFVIVPWLDVEPDAVLVGHGPIVELAIDVSGIRPLRDEPVVT